MSSFDRIDYIRRYLRKHGWFLPAQSQVGLWRGGWQPEIVRHVLQNRKAIVKGPRQGTGKTFSVGLTVVDDLLEGRRVGVVMPTQRQGGRIFKDRVCTWMQVFDQGTFRARNGAILRRIKPDGALETNWSNGAQLVAFSGNESATAGGQGYTVDTLIVDEAHTATRELLGTYQPLVKIAMQQGRGRIVLIGVGGDTPEHLIEVMQVPGTGFETLFYDDDKIIAIDDAERALSLAEQQALDMDKSGLAWRTMFAEDEASMSPDDYRQMYKCLPRLLNARRLYQVIPDRVEAHGMTSRKLFAFGIDVGKKDDTVLTVVQVRPGLGEDGQALTLKTHHVFKGSYVDQAQDIAEQVAAYYRPVGGMMYRPIGNIAIETNGPGEPLADILEAGAFPDIQRIHTTAKNKKWFIRTLQAGARGGWFACEDQEARRQLLNLSVGYDTKGNMIVDHSDLHSSLTMAVAAADAVWVAA